MGKAFTEEEKEKIKIKIMEEGLKLFHENGNKALSIRELTDRVGISQGGFYTFFESKEDLVLEIVKYRSLQKMEYVSKTFEQSLADPVGYMCAVVYEYFIDIAHKVQQKRMYSDMIHLILMRNSEFGMRNGTGGAGSNVNDDGESSGAECKGKIRNSECGIRNGASSAGSGGDAGKGEFRSGGDEVFTEYLLKLKVFWEAHGKKVEMDLDGIWCMVSTVCVLVDNREIYKENYMDDMLKMIIEAAIRKYVIVK